MKLVQQADLVERGLQHSRTRSCWPLPRNPPSPPSPSSQRVPDGHQEIKALDQSFSSTIVRDPLSLLLGYLRGWLSRICCGDIFWSVPALSGTVSPLSGLGRSVSWPARVSGALPARTVLVRATRPPPSLRARPHTQGCRRCWKLRYLDSNISGYI